MSINVFIIQIVRIVELTVYIDQKNTIHYTVLIFVMGGWRIRGSEDGRMDGRNDGWEDEKSKGGWDGWKKVERTNGWKSWKDKWMEEGL